MKLLVIFTREEVERMLAGGVVLSSCLRCQKHQVFGIARDDESDDEACQRVSWEEVTGGTGGTKPL